MPKPNAPTSFTANVSTVAAATTNANNQLWYNALTNYVMFADVVATVSVTHVFSAGATFNNGTVDFSGATVANLTAGASTFTAAVTFANNIVMTAASSKIIPGATAFNIRNNADSASNLQVTDVGLVTVRNGLVVTGGGFTCTGTINQTGAINATGAVSAGAGGSVFTDDGNLGLILRRANAAPALKWDWTGTGATSAFINILSSGSLNVSAGLTVTGAILPATTAIYDLGATGTRWNSLYLSSGIVAGGSATFGGTVGVTGATTLGVATITNGLTISGAGLSVTGTAAFVNGVTVGGTLGVTGQITGNVTGVLTVATGSRSPGRSSRQRRTGRRFKAQPARAMISSSPIRSIPSSRMSRPGRTISHSPRM